jgi:hypothetical protein
MIPLTASEEIQMFNQEQVLQKTIKTMLFLSIMNKNKDEKLITLLNSGKNKNQFQFTGLSKDYLEKVKMANEGRYGSKRKKDNFGSPTKHSQVYDFKTETKDLNPLKGKFGIVAKTTAKKPKIFG